MANYLARVAAAGARITPTMRPTATPFPPLFRPLPVPRPHIEAPPAEEASGTLPQQPQPGAQPTQKQELEVPPSAPARPKATEPAVAQGQPAPETRGPETAPASAPVVAAAATPVAPPEVARVRVPRIPKERQPEARIRDIAPARVVAPGAERSPAIAPAADPLPVVTAPESVPAPIKRSAPDFAPPPDVPVATPPIANDAAPQSPLPPPGLAVSMPASRHDPVWPAPPAEAGGRQRAVAASRISIGTVDVRVVNTPPPAMVNPPAPVPASAPEAPALARFRLRP